SAFIIFAFNLASNLYILPYTNQLKNSFENNYVKKNDPSSKSIIHMKLNDHTYIYMDNFDNKSKIGSKFKLDNFKVDILTRKLVADEIKWDFLKRSWKLVNYTVRDIVGLNETFTGGLSLTKDTVLDMRPDDFSAYDNIFENL